MGLFGWGKKSDDDYEDEDDTEGEDEEERQPMPTKLFGKGGAIDYSISQEDANCIAWSRLVELGMATEAVEQCMEECPDDPDYRKMYTEVAVAEAEYASRPWWQKVF